MKVKIGNYDWNVRFVSKEELKGSDGQTRCNDFEILIRDDLNEESTNVIVIHEIVHALLDTQGRVYQRKFDLEEVCELVGWNADAILKARDLIMKRRKRR